MGKHFLWDPIEDNIVKEIDDAGTTIADYTTEPYLYGDLISQHRDGQSNFYHYDGQGSTASLTDLVCNITDTYEYSAFGEPTRRTGSTANPFQYIGQFEYYHNVTALEYSVRHRDYQPPRGRWLSVDLLGLIYDFREAMHGSTIEFMRSTALSSERGPASSFHFVTGLQSRVDQYSYFDSQPLNAVDPSGLLKTPWYIACVAGCRTSYPRIGQVALRLWCEGNCGEVERLRHSIPATTRAPLFYGHYCGYLNAVSFTCTCPMDRSRPLFKGSPTPWDSLDMACAFHDCCFSSWYWLIYKPDECNAPLCATARQVIADGCSDSMTPFDCVTVAAEILGGPLCWPHL